MSQTWQNLSPDSVLDRLEATLNIKLSNVCIKRNSYINRVYEVTRIDTGEGLIAKFYRPGRWTPSQIQTEHDLITKLSAADIAVIPPLLFAGKTLFTVNEFSFAVFPKKGGRAVDEFDKDTWLQVGRLLGRVHLTSQSLGAVNRVQWRPSVATKQHLAILKQTETVTPEFRSAFFKLAENFVRDCDPLFENSDALLIHGDCHKGNFIYRPGEGIYLIDFDDIAVGPAVQDLWMLLPGDPKDCENELAWFLEGYETFREFPIESLRLIPALRAMRIIHFAAWCAVQANEPEFEDNFPDWGKGRYWNELMRELQDLMTY